MNKCFHDNCLTCPYPDCISDSGSKKNGKPGRKPMDPEIVHQHRIEYQRKYNNEHKEQMSEYYKEYNKQKLLTKPLKNTVWVTNGVNNKRIKHYELEDYKKQGYMRGRTTSHKKGI